MSLQEYKITDTQIAQKGVVAAPDILAGTAAQNKAIFDRLIREAVKSVFNAMIDALSAETGASEIGAAIEGVTGNATVAGMLQGLKGLVDARETIADAEASFALKEDKSVTAGHIKAVGFNAQTGVFTFTKENGSTITIDTALEKVATNWTYDAQTQSLVLTLADGTMQSVPLSAFITETEFQESETIEFSVSNHVVTATVRTGSITDTMLSSALITQLQGYVSAAAGSATAAAAAASASLAAQATAEAAQSAAAASATAAEGSATNAETAAAAAATSATAAENAKDAAIEALEAFHAPTATAQTVQPGTPATASYDGQNFTFGIPQGIKGDTPVKGTDYWTSADKQEIVQDVLDALPTWTGGSY